MLDLTDEQKEVVRAVNDAHYITVQAYAGAGKTSTILEIARTYPRKRFFYTAFNRAIIKEVKQKCSKQGLSNLYPRTFHSATFSWFRQKHRDLTQYIANVRQKELIDFLRSSEYKIKSYFYGSVIVNLFYAYLHSSHSELNERTLKELISCDRELQRKIQLLSAGGKNYEEIVANALPHVRELFNGMYSGRLKISHDFYLKLAQLEEAKIFEPFDAVIVDEAQDVNPVMLDFLLKSGKQVIAVGDRHQKIYGFRKAKSIMDQIQGKSLKLTISFRFNQDIADLAGEILRLKGDNVRITGKGSGSGTSRAFISRTNAMLIKFIDESDRFSLLKDPGTIFEIPLGIAIKFIPRGFWSTIKEFLGIEKVTIPELSEETGDFLSRFKSLDGLKEYAVSTEDVELLSAVRIAEEYRYRLCRIFEKAKVMYELSNLKKNDSTMCLSTAHSAKGLEWDEVIIANDFRDLRSLINEKFGSHSAFLEAESSEKEEVEEEINLRYVAVTRARNKVSFLQ